MKTAILDASSAIIIAKAGLHNILVQLYGIIMPGSVYVEITGNPYPGAAEYKLFFDEEKIKVKKSWARKAVRTYHPDLERLGAGERDVLKMYFAGFGDFVIVDDGAAVKYCLTNEIPFINALLLPVIMGYGGIAKPSLCEYYHNEVLAVGRYADQVILRAKSLSEEDLAFFMP